MRPLGTDSARAAQPPLLFLHGASHGAWCWAVSASVKSGLSYPCHPLGVCHVVALVTWTNGFVPQALFNLCMYGSFSMQPVCLERVIVCLQHAT